MFKRIGLALKTLVNPYKHTKNPEQLMSKAEKEYFDDKLLKTVKPYQDTINRQKEELDKAKSGHLKSVAIGAGLTLTGQYGYNKYKNYKRAQERKLAKLNQS